MANVIHLLPDSVANQIAAGEVIQRPASVIKEMMENAIDAGASVVKVLITDAGRTLIQIVDDGCGMSETDARLAFERHATSKISDAKDLYSLHTMGFRGEALASIAAVAQVELFTRRTEDELGVHIEISASQITNQEPIATAVGSRFMVKNLFFNIPARRRFLKSDAAEMRHVTSEFLRVALAHTDVTFSLTSNGTPIYTLPAGNMKQRVAQVVGRTLSQELLPIEVETSVASIKGFIGSPQTAKKTGSDQYFFVNERFMKSAYFHKAVTDAYKNIIPSELSPAYFIYINVDPQCIDVNVHPQKTEIKFDNDAGVWQLINVSVRECLGRCNITPSIDFSETNPVEIPPYIPGVSVYKNESEIYNPFKRETEQIQSDFGYSRNPYQPRQNVQGWENLYKSSANTDNPADSGIIPSQMDKLPFDSFPDLSQQPENFFQIGNKYVAVVTEQGLMLIDQHRAYERIQYELISSTLTIGNVASQQLLFPEYMAMNVEDACIISELDAELRRVGFDLQYDEESGQMAINAVPANIDAADASGLLEAIVYDSRNGEINISDNVMEYVTQTVAKKGALPYGKALKKNEMAVLYQKLVSCKAPSVTPSGKNIFVILSVPDIDSRFNSFQL